MHTLFICMSAFAESTNNLYGLWKYTALLVICKNLNNTLMNPTDVGMSSLFLTVKSKYAEYSVKNVFQSNIFAS